MERSLLLAICRVIKERREFLKLSQDTLASRAQLHRTYISDIERGSRNVSLQTLFRLAKALEMSASAMIQAAEMTANLECVHVDAAHHFEGAVERIG